MRDTTELKRKRSEIIKAARFAIRFKHSILADREIEDTVADLEKKMDKALQLGQPFEFDIVDIFKMMEV